jgi:hypothetical protein
MILMMRVNKDYSTELQYMCCIGSERLVMKTILRLQCTSSIPIPCSTVIMFHEEGENLHSSVLEDPEKMPTPTESFRTVHKHDQESLQRDGCEEFEKPKPS